MPANLDVYPMSFVTFKTGSETEEIFLLCSDGFERGPGIERDGIGEPRM